MADSDVPAAQSVETVVSYGGWCDKTSTLQCSQCKNASYCSTACQQADWRLHKHLCETFAKYKPKPAANYRRVILLSEEYSVPAFAWLPVQLVDPGAPESETASEAAAASGVVTFKGILKAPLFKPQTNEAATNLYNECIDTLIGEELGYSLRGSWILMAKIQVGAEFFVVDAELNDFTIGLREFIKRLRKTEQDAMSDQKGFTVAEVDGGDIRVRNVHGAF